MLYLLFILFVLLESSLFPLPLVLGLVLVATVTQRSSIAIIAGFISGLFLDIFLLRPLGTTSIFFLLLILITQQYTRRFEIASMYFVLFAEVIGTILYDALFYQEFSILIILLNTVITMLLFIMFSGQQSRRNQQIEPYSISKFFQI